MSALHVLIVEDSLIYRRLLSRTLTQWGYIVSEAENGVAALEILSSQPISMVISDWDMPEMDGLTLCQTIRNRQFGHYVYVILLTARENAGDLTQGFDAGADDFLSKPVEQDELRARLHAGVRILTLEATLAARVQHSVLPSHRLRFGNYFSDWLFLPSAWVSGDVFNIFPLDSHIGFYCVDVSGHGVGAAMMSLAVARQFLHGRVVDRFLFTDRGGIQSPAEVIGILNSRFCSEESDITSYFTIIYGVIDPESGRGVLCQAGHPTPVIVNADSAVTSVGNGGPPVGLMPDLSWEDVAFTLNPGDRLCLFSDGITECENVSGEQFGPQRLERWLHDHARLPVDQLLARFGDHLTGWRNANRDEPTALTDDVSLLVIERQGEQNDY